MKFVTNIQPGPESLPAYLVKIWRYRYMVVTFARRELAVKYSGTLLGLLGLLAYPAVLLLVYFLFFTVLVKLPMNGDYPYILFVFTGLMPWLFFSSAINASGAMFMANRELIKKVYFPRLLILLSRIAVNLIELAVMMLLFLLTAYVTDFMPGRAILLLPLVVMLTVVVVLSLSIWVSLVVFKLKDTLQFLPLATNLFMWFTPVFYPLSLLPTKYLFIAYINPMAMLVDMYRVVLLGYNANLNYWYISFAVTLVLLMSGIYLFIQAEDVFAENM
ncbi:MAG TPA: ABC transporter permease [Chitinophagales bacterium]|nr:ABC transporter permease [Chitinophagales bacterium]